MKIVIKIGGSLMKEGLPESLIADASRLSTSNELVIVHGGGDVVTQVATKLGKEQRFITSPDGIKSRYTDKETVEIYQMVMTGLLAKRLALALSKSGTQAVSISGTDAGLLKGKRKSKLVMIDDRGRKVAIDGGYTGKVEAVNVEVLQSLLSQGYVPVVSPVAVSDAYDPLNIDGDRAASAVATALHADTILFATNVAGLSLGGEIVSRMTPDEASSRLPEIGFGMQKKVMAGAEAVAGGVGEAIICSGTRESPIEKGLAHDGCTVISR